MVKIIYPLIAYLLLILGTVFTHGFYSFSGVVLLLISLGILLSEDKLPSYSDTVNKLPSYLLSFVLINSVVFSFLLYGGIYQSNLYYLKKISTLLLGLSVWLSLLYILPSDRSWVTNVLAKFLLRHKFSILICISIVVNILMIISSPDPYIDIFRSLKYGTRELASLTNPYEAVYPQLYEGKTLNYFSYFPAILGYFLPFNLLFGDVRMGIVGAHIIILFLLFTLFRQKKINTDISEVMLLLFAYYPLQPYITEQSFVDIVIVLGLILILYIMNSGRDSKWHKWFYLVIALTMNTKQIFFVVLPLFLYLSKYLRNLREVIKVISLASLLVLPFLIWSWKDFVYDTVLIYLQPPQGVSADLSLNLRALIVNFFELKLDQNVFLALIAVYSVFIILTAARKREFYKPICLFFFGFFLFGSIAYLNHYYLVGNILLIYIVSLILNSNNRYPAKSGEKWE